MAFNKDKLDVMGGNAKSGMKRKFLYEPGADTITAANFFPIDVGFRTGDLIETIPDTGAPAVYRVTITAGSVVLAAAA